MDNSLEKPATESPIRSTAVLAVLLAICYGVAALGGLFTAQSVGDWYVQLNKPSWTPPGSVIGTVWTFLYGMMAVSAWLAWRQGGWVGGGHRRLRPWLIAFAVQLMLNLSWSALFFGMQSPGLAMIDLVLLWVAILATILLMRPLTTWGPLLLLPYLAWVTFAGYLNLTIWQMN